MKKAFKIFAGLLLALVLCDAWLTYFHVPEWKPAFVSTSPDGRFSVSGYYNLPSPFFGELWGNDGTVVLRENKTGKVLQRGTIDYLPAVQGQVSWYVCNRDFYPEYERCVYVQYVDTWPLPPEEPGK
ncbi:MAG: hypothetical protein LBU76_07910 [Azoarcus sp.]|jgi:hypothetical protein|nr:hypothetical protein [Azoarcus sp.]